MTDAIALPPELGALAGRIFDADAHEMMPAQVWESEFGPEVRPLVDAWTWRGEGDAGDKNHPNAPDYAGDIGEVGADIANVKGCRAPGAVDMDRRLEVMDAMGISQQLMFPTGVGMYGLGLILKKDDKGYLPTIADDREKLGRRCVDLYTDWAVGIAKNYKRILPVAPLYGDDLADLMQRTERLIKDGVRAFWIPASSPPVGLSPAHPDLDRFWRLLEESGSTPMLHVGAEANFFGSAEWKEAPAFKGYRALSEFDTDPWTLSTKYMPYQNFVQTMVNGGVFVRHPNLSVAVVEATAAWVGAMLRINDMWYQNLNTYNKHESRLAEKPSDMFKRHVRVSVFPFEDIAYYIEKEGLEDIICFATDYPHVEGGKDMMTAMYKKVAPFGPEVVEKFFVKNAEILFKR